MKKKKEYHKKYYKENKLKMKKQMKKSYKKNIDERKHYSRTYLTQKKMEKKYDRPIKNIIRERIIREISKHKIKNILTLESEDFLFCKEIPEKKVYVFENNKTIFNLMQKPKPKNVILNFGDISDFRDYDMSIDCIYLDFCCTYLTGKETIYLLKEKIKDSKLFVITFCTWDETKKPNGDYQFELINQLQTLLDINFKAIHPPPPKIQNPGLSNASDIKSICAFFPFIIVFLLSNFLILSSMILILFLCKAYLYLFLPYVSFAIVYYALIISLYSFGNILYCIYSSFAPGFSKIIVTIVECFLSLYPCPKITLKFISKRVCN